jgi:hypothetical protein
VLPLDGGFGSPGRLQEVGINHIDYETYNDLYNGDIVYSICQGDSGGPNFDRESKRSEGLDRCDDLRAVE